MQKKIGRNDSCPCGSGKKYKKCCLNKDEEQRSLELIKSPNAPKKSNKINPKVDSGEKMLLSTVSGELFQLARICYKIHNKKNVLDKFNRLKCIEYDSDQKRWVWKFESEAMSVTLDKEHSEIPKNMHPLVIGSFFVRASDNMILNVNSWKRAVQAITFFDKHIPKSDAEVSCIQIVNKLFSHDEYSPDIHSRYFDEMEVHSSSEALDDYMQKAQVVKNSIESPEKRLNVISKITEKMAKKSYPMIEELEPTFYEDGIQSLESVLKCREIVAVKHWQGETDFSFYDLMQQILPKI